MYDSYICAFYYDAYSDVYKIEKTCNPQKKLNMLNMSHAKNGRVMSMWKFDNKMAAVGYEAISRYFSKTGDMLQNNFCKKHIITHNVFIFLINKFGGKQIHEMPYEGFGDVECDLKLTNKMLSDIHCAFMSIEAPDVENNKCIYAILQFLNGGDTVAQINVSPGFNKYKSVMSAVCNLRRVLVVSKNYRSWWAPKHEYAPKLNITDNCSDFMEPYMTHVTQPIIGGFDVVIVDDCCDVERTPRKKTLHISTCDAKSTDVIYEITREMAVNCNMEVDYQIIMMKTPTCEIPYKQKVIATLQAIKKYNLNYTIVYVNSLYSAVSVCHLFAQLQDDLQLNLAVYKDENNCEQADSVYIRQTVPRHEMGDINVTVVVYGSITELPYVDAVSIFDNKPENIVKNLQMTCVKYGSTYKKTIVRYIIPYSDFEYGVMVANIIGKHNRDYVISHIEFNGEDNVNACVDDVMRNID